MASTLANKINERLKATGLSKRAASLKAGLGPDIIRDILRGQSKSPSVDTIKKLSEVLGTTAAYLMSENTGQVTDKINLDHPQDLTEPLQRSTQKPPVLQSMARDVLVRGTVVAGDDGDFRFNGDVVDRVRRPIGISPDADVFGLWVQGDSMSPRYNRGDLVFINTTRPAEIGCDVVVELHPEASEQAGACFLKGLVKVTASKLVLVEYGPKRREFEIERRRVKQLWRVYTNNDLYGTG